VRKVGKHTKCYADMVKGRDNFGDIGADGRIILKYIIKQFVSVCEQDAAGYI
jgi:hypothetical protein